MRVSLTTICSTIQTNSIILSRRVIFFGDNLLWGHIVLNFHMALHLFCDVSLRSALTFHCLYMLLLLIWPVNDLHFQKLSAKPSAQTEKALNQMKPWSPCKYKQLIGTGTVTCKQTSCKYLQTIQKLFSSIKSSGFSIMLHWNCIKPSNYKES